MVFCYSSLNRLRQAGKHSIKQLNQISLPSEKSQSKLEWATGQVLRVVKVQLAWKMSSYQLASWPGWGCANQAQTEAGRESNSANYQAWFLFNKGR
jgi:hypothetical protein